MNFNKPWTPELDHQLKLLDEMGKSARDISQILQRSIYAVDSRLRRLRNGVKCYVTERKDIALTLADAEQMWKNRLAGRTFGTPKPESAIRPIRIPQREHVRSLTGNSSAMCAL